MNRFSRHLLTLALSLFTIAGIAPAQTAMTAMKAKPAAAAPASGGLIDINTASADQLKTLKGIGDAYAKRIIDGRPYTAKNQLSTRGILPDAAYNGIKDQIVAKASKK